MINTIARGIVNVVKAGYRQRTWLSGIALGLTLVVAVVYLFLGALQVDPLRSTYRVTVQLPESGGLIANQDVAVRGIPVGRIESLRVTHAGVEAVATIKQGVKIPKFSPVRVSGLSAAGEQYIDFLPTSTDGPFLGNNDVVDADAVNALQPENERIRSTPVPLSQMLMHAEGVLDQVDTDKLEIIKRELGMTAAGPQKLTDIVDGGMFLLSTLDSVLPQTVSLLRDSRTVLTMFSDVNAGLATTTGNLDEVLAATTKMEGGYRRLVDRAPAMLSSVDGLFDDNSDTMVGLLANLTTASQLLYVRVPALNALFPRYRGSTLEALGTIMHDNGIWASADIYPRYVCDYGTPRRISSAADYPEPFLYGYCFDDDPSVLIRGARNAPRPAGDDTAGPPPGADLAQTTDPTPQGRYTIPTPYGGPVLPIEPPH